MWEVPPVIKVYEALGAVVDGRLEIAGTTAKCYSSSGNKFYNIQYDAANNAIMVNDNGSYWKGYLGYPAIAYLFQIGVLEYNAELASHFKDIAWKDINQKFENDFTRTVNYVFQDIDAKTIREVEEYSRRVRNDIEVLALKKLGPMQKPPSVY